MKNDVDLTLEKFITQIYHLISFSSSVNTECMAVITIDVGENSVLDYISFSQSWEISFDLFYVFACSFKPGQMF